MGRPSAMSCLLTCLGFTICISEMVVSPTPLNIGNGMVYLGTVDGKSFYVEIGHRSWSEAKRRCNESNMELAEITTVAQNDFLKNATNSGTFPFVYRYWTGGKYTLRHSDFVWDGSGAVPSAEAVAGLDLSFVEITHCLTWMNGGYQVQPCAQANLYLCQFVH